MVDHISHESMYEDDNNSFFVRGLDLIAKTPVFNYADERIPNDYYYIQNRHGDVVTIVDYDGTAVNTYEYDEYDSITAETEGINNPFKYAGEVQNMPNSLVYLRNRVYIPRLQRFLQEDPIRDGTNWYVYCNSNPLNAIDPLGLKLKLIGTGEQVQAIWQELKQLSHDELELKQLTDEDGNLIDSYEVSVAKQNNGQYQHGTELIRRVSSAEESITVQIGWKGNKYYWNHNSVIFDPESDPDIWTLGSKGYAYLAKRPEYIGLAHELIHADHDIRKIDENININAEYSYKISRNDSRTENASREEYATIGIDYNVPGDITENMIRKEHFYNERAAYMQIGY